MCAHCIHMYLWCQKVVFSQGILRISPFDDEGRPYLLGALVQLYSLCAGSPAYEKLVAADDMVLEKAQAPWTFMRVATVTSAYGGCNGMLSLNHFSKKLGVPMEEGVRVYHVSGGGERPHIASLPRSGGRNPRFLLLPLPGIRLFAKVAVLSHGGPVPLQLDRLGGGLHGRQPVSEYSCDAGRCN